MVARIRLEAENTTGAAFESLKNSTLSVDHTAESLGDTLGELQRRFDEAKASIGRLEAAEKEAAAAGRSMGDSLHTAGSKADGMKTPVRSAQSAITGFGEQLLKLWALKETFTKVAQGVKYLADQGNPAANSLTRAVEDLTQQFVKLGETSAFQRMIEGVTGATEIATESLGEMSKETNTWAGNFGWAMRQAQDTLGIIIAAQAEAAGLIARGSMDDAMRAARERENAIKNHEQLMDQEHQRMDVEKQLGEVEKIRSEFRKVSQQEEAQQWAETFHSIDDVVAAQKEELEQLSKMAASAEASASEQEEAKRRLTELEKRRQDLTREGIEKERRQTEEAIADRRAAREAEIEEAVADHEKFLSEQAEIEKKNAEEAARARDLAHEKLVKSLEQREAAHQERIKKIQEAAQLTGKNGVAQGLQALGSKVTRDKAVRKYVADREELAASGVRDSSEGMNPLELQKMIDWARRQARQAARRDIQSGAANADLTQIQGEMATKVIDQAEASGKLGKNTADALREAAKSAAKNRAEMESINEEVKQIREWFSEFNKGSSRDRQRAQRRQ